jgi:Zn-dependent protease with chaperone function
VSAPVQYPAKWSSPKTGEELIEGVISCERWALRFESDGAQFSFPWQEVRVHTGGGEEDQVFFSITSRPEISLLTETTEVLDDPVFLQISSIRQQLEFLHHRKARREYSRAMIKFFGVFVILAALLYLAGGVAVRMAVATVSPAWEKQIGQEVLEEFHQQYPLVKDSAEAAQMTALAQRLARGQPGIKHRLEVYVIKHLQPNALAFPGGFIVVTEGLLLLADGPGEVAGVLAHEIAHIRQRHGIQALIKSGGPFYALRILLGDRGIGGVLSQGSHFLLHQKFSRAHEEEADALAWKYMVDAKMDPRGLITLLEKVMELEGEGPGLPAFALTHPPTRDRVEALRKRWEQLPDKHAFAPGGVTP